MIMDSFLLRDFYKKALAENLMMHLLVEAIYTWHQKAASSGVVEKYRVKPSEINKRPWGDHGVTMGYAGFCLIRPQWYALAIWPEY